LKFDVKGEKVSGLQKDIGSLRKEESNHKILPETTI